MYLSNRLECDAHIFTQGRYGGADVPFGGLVNFGLGGSNFRAKNCVFVTFAIFLEPLRFQCSYLNQGRSWAELVPFGGLIDFGLGGSIFGAKNYVFGKKSCYYYYYSRTKILLAPYLPNRL